MVKKHKYKVLLSFIAIVYVVVTIIMLNPLRKPVEQIREDLLEYIPVGTSMDDVHAIIKKNNWRIFNIVNSGYVIFRGIPTATRNHGDYIDEVTIVGTKHIRITMGGYIYWVAHVSVVVYFGFDENAELVDIAVRKDGDSF